MKATGLFTFVSIFCLCMVCGCSSTPGMLLVANKSDNTLFFINGETFQLMDSTSTGDDPHEVLVLSTQDRAYTANMQGNSISVIDLSERNERHRIDLTDYGKPHGLALSKDGTKLYVTSQATKTVLEIDVATEEILRTFKTEQEGTHMLAMGKDGTILYAANLGSGNTSVIDLQAGEVVKTLATGEGSEGIDVRPDGKEVWVTARSGSVAIIDTENNEVVEHLAAGGLPIRVKFTPNGKHALVSCNQADEVIIFDVATRQPHETIKTGKGPVGIQIRPDGKLAFVANAGGNTVSVIDLVSMTISETIPTGKTPDGMAYK